jgi:signal transduction histidine kinase
MPRPEPVAQVTGDPDRLQQVAWNLLSNAIKFTPGGRVDISLSERTRLFKLPFAIPVKASIWSFCLTFSSASGRAICRAHGAFAG